MTLLRETLPFLIPVLIALIGAYFAIYQLKLNAITQARIKWIENVRDLLSSLIYIVNIIGTEYSDMDEELNENEKVLSDEDFDKYEKELEKRVEEKIKIHIHEGDRKLFQLKLYLNKSHIDHLELIRLLDEFIDKSWEEEEGLIKECNGLEDKIVDISRKIIQEEWNKVYKANKLNPLY